MIFKNSEELRYKLRYPILADVCCEMGIPISIIDNSYDSIRLIYDIEKNDFEIALKAFIVTYIQFNVYYSRGSSKGLFNLRIALASGFIATGMKYLNVYKDRMDRQNQ